MPLSPHLDFLTKFARNHFSGDPSYDGMLQLKLEHTLCVFENAQKILQNESLSGTTAELATLAALYHDIGRFPQFAEYGTFNDRTSVNHGRLGVLTLRKLNMPGNLSATDWRLIRLAIGQHNIRDLSPTLPEPVATITKLVRDADKIDIFRIMSEHFSSDTSDPAITHGFKDIPDQYSDTIYKSVMAQKNGDYGDIQCANDFKLLIIGWVFDLNFRTSFSLLEKRGLIKRIFSLLPKDVKIQDLEKKVNKFIRYNKNSPS
jgi:putative nucleotidyltransferase with HDIG domain